VSRSRRWVRAGNGSSLVFLEGRGFDRGVNGEMSGSTIAAIASPPGGGARGVIRLSGSRARELVAATWKGDALDLGSRSLRVGRFEDGVGSQPLLLLWMPAPKSFTREDVAEFHLVGSPPLLTAAMSRLVALGARVAEPGEFTRRAFLAGRIDLTRAEGVLALVQSTNEAQARAARGLLFGGLEARVAAAREELVDARMLCEASLDFDPDDAGHVPEEELRRRMQRIESVLSEVLGFEVQRAGRSGLPRVVLAGAPNAGKSALFNALVGEEGALVSDHAGTTRDVLEARVEAGGQAFRLIDTAGVDATVRGSIDAEAQEMARSARTDADLVVWVLDARRTDREAIETERSSFGDRPICLAWNKIDLVPGPPPEWALGMGAAVGVSARTGAGVERLKSAIGEAIGADGGGGIERETALRHRTAIDGALRELDSARGSLAAGLALELVAEHLRRACDALDDVSGATTAEDVLDRIFARFCLGK
jgi:tRNA modification GTPase